MKWGHVVREKLLVLLLRFVLFARNVGRNRESANNCEPRPKFEWPYVMNSFITMQRHSFRQHGFGSISMHAGITGITALAVKSGLTSRVPCWEIIADNLKKLDGVWAGSQLSTLKGERFGLWTRVATESVSWFLELERAIYCFAVDLIS